MLAGSFSVQKVNPRIHFERNQMLCSQNTNTINHSASGHHKFIEVIVQKNR